MWFPPVLFSRAIAAGLVPRSAVLLPVGFSRRTAHDHRKLLVIVATKNELPTSTEKHGDRGYQERTAHEHRKAR
ncbi:MAG: hypothetical protein DMG05_23735 [Acidobacteria bacterium]|nr:MAG: hypothetical protein DMG05_23735 [Acidobacteriota bacterium]